MPTPTLERLLKERVSALVGEELQAVEAEIGRQLDSPVGLIQEMGEYIAGAGGKRLRPMLLLLASRVSGYRGPRYPDTRAASSNSMGRRRLPPAPAM